MTKAGGMAGAFPGQFFARPCCSLTPTISIATCNIRLHVQSRLTFGFYVHYSGHMDIEETTIVFDALSQETRLRAFRLLVEAGVDGLPAGAISEELGTPHNTLSFHLNHLSNAGIVRSRRKGRSVVYTADFEMIRDVIGFLVKDCCSREVANIRKDKKKGCSIIELVDCCSSDITAVARG